MRSRYEQIQEFSVYQYNQINSCQYDLDFFTTKLIISRLVRIILVLLQDQSNGKGKKLGRSESARALRRIPSSPSIILGMKKGVDCIQKKRMVTCDDDESYDAGNSSMKSSTKTIKKTEKIWTAVKYSFFFFSLVFIITQILRCVFRVVALG